MNFYKNIRKPDLRSSRQWQVGVQKSSSPPPKKKVALPSKNGLYTGVPNLQKRPYMKLISILNCYLQHAQYFAFKTSKYKLQIIREYSILCVLFCWIVPKNLCLMRFTNIDMKEIRPLQLCFIRRLNKLYVGVLDFWFRIRFHSHINLFISKLVITPERGFK